jgi:hypothetical protein
MRASFAHPKSLIDPRIIGCFSVLASWTVSNYAVSAPLATAAPATSPSRPSGRLKEIINGFVPQENRAGSPPGRGRGNEKDNPATEGLRL